MAANQTSIIENNWFLPSALPTNTAYSRALNSHTTLTNEHISTRRRPLASEEIPISEQPPLEQQLTERPLNERACEQIDTATKNSTQNSTQTVPPTVHHQSSLIFATNRQRNHHSPHNTASTTATHKIIDDALSLSGTSIECNELEQLNEQLSSTKLRAGEKTNSKTTSKQLANNITTADVAVKTEYNSEKVAVAVGNSNQLHGNLSEGTEQFGRNLVNYGENEDDSTNNNFDELETDETSESGFNRPLFSIGTGFEDEPDTAGTENVKKITFNNFAKLFFEIFFWTLSDRFVGRFCGPFFGPFFEPFIIHTLPALHIFTAFSTLDMPIYGVGS